MPIMPLLAFVATPVQTSQNRGMVIASPAQRDIVLTKTELHATKETNENSTCRDINSRCDGLFLFWSPEKIDVKAFFVSQLICIQTDICAVSLSAEKEQIQVVVVMNGDYVSVYKSPHLATSNISGIEICIFRSPQTDLSVIQVNESIRFETKTCRSWSAYSTHSSFTN